MSDYIKREDALNGCKQWLEPKERDEQDTMWNHGIEACLNEIKHHTPSADVMPVRHGRWINSKAGGVLCSECYSYAPNVEKGSFTTRRIKQEKSAYCPNCGARMDGGNNE